MLIFSEKRKPHSQKFAGLSVCAMSGQPPILKMLKLHREQSQKNLGSSPHSAWSRESIWFVYDGEKNHFSSQSISFCQAFQNICEQMGKWNICFNYSMADMHYQLLYLRYFSGCWDTQLSRIWFLLSLQYDDENTV